MDLKLVYMAMIFWGAFNLPFTFLFYYMENSFLGSIIFLVGFFILIMIGLVVAHNIDKYTKIYSKIGFL